MALTKVTGDFIKDGVLTQAHLHSSHGITSTHIGEGDKLFFTNARARGAISVSGNALSYNSSTGVITSNFEESPTFTGKIIAGGGVQFTGGTIATATAVLHTNNVVYFRGGSSGLFLQNADGSEGMFMANDHIRFETGSTERMRINSSGNVGIGNTSPDAFLHIGGAPAISAEALIVRGNANGQYAVSIEQDNSSGFGMIIDTDSTDSSDPAFKVQNPNGSLLDVRSDGTIGIGTTSPTHTLHVKNSSGDVRGIMIEQGVTTSYAELAIKSDIREFRLGTGGDGTNNSRAENVFYIYDATTGGAAGHRFEVGSTGDVKILNGALKISGDDANYATLTESGAGLLTIATVDDFVVDCGSDIVLDAAGVDIRLQSNGTQIGNLNMDSSNLNIISSVQDRDILFKGNDGGSTITALTLDMSEGGDATFAGKISSTHIKYCNTSISNSYVRVYFAAANTNQLATAVRITGTAHGNSHVANFTADILVNHYQDINIKSKSGAYTQGTLKVESNNNGDYTLSYKSASANAATYYFKIEAISDNVDLTTLPSSTSATNTTHEHTTVFGSNETGAGGTLEHKYGGAATFAGTINSDNITVGKADGNNSSISLTANTGNWTFTNVQASRNLEISDSDGTGVAMTIDTSANTTFANDVTISGNLTVNGTTTTVNQTNLDVSDNIIGLNRGASSNANDSGLIIERGSTGDNAAILWDESIDQYVFGLTTATPSDTGNVALSAFVGIKTGAITASGNITASSSTGHFSVVNSSAYQLNGTYVMDSSRNLVNIGNITATGNTILGNAMTDKVVVHGHLGVGDDVYPKIAYPGQNALWGGTGSTTGQIVIDLPGTLNNYDMMYMEIDIYEYSGVAATKLIVGGHNWNSGGNSNTGTTQWYNVNVQVIGALDKPVYVGRRNDGTNERRCIAIGETTSTWSYATVHVHKVHGAEFYTSAIDWVADWNIAQTTSTSYFTKNPTTNFNANNSYTLETNGIMEANMVYGTASVRSPIFYDLDNTAYYTNPAGTSVMNDIYIDDYIYHKDDTHTYFGFTGNDAFAMVFEGTTRLSVADSADPVFTYAAHINMSGKDIDQVNQLHFQDNVRFYDDGNDSYLNFVSGDSNTTGIKFYSGGGFKGYVYGDSGGFGLLDSDGNWSIRIPLGGSGLELRSNNNVEFTVNNDHTLSHGSSRSPIFYDSDSTSYYVDPATGSNLKGVVINTTSTSAVGNQLKIYTTSHHQYPQIHSNAALEAMWNYKNTASEWYVGLRTSAQLVGTTGFHFYNTTSSQTVGGWDVNGHSYSIGSSRAPIFYDSNNTGYYSNQAGRSNFASLDLNDGGVWDATTQGTSKGSLHIDPNSATDHAGGSITFGASDTSGGATGQAGIYVRSDGSYGTRMYLSTTDSYASGSKTTIRLEAAGGLYVDRGSLYAPLFYDSNNTAYYLDPASSGSKMVNLNLISDGTHNTNDAALYVQRNGNEDWGITVKGNSNATEYGMKVDLAGSSATMGYAYYSAGSLRYLVGHSSAIHHGDIRSPIFYDSDDTTYYMNYYGGGKLRGNFEFAASDTATGYSTASIELRESNYTANSSATPPYIGFHWGGVVASNIAIESNGRIAIRNNPGNAYEKFIASNVYAASDFQGPIYYDSNNTAYYTDPATLSVMHSLKLIEFQNHTPRWDFSAYVVETPHHYSTSGTGNMYIGENNYVNIRSTADISGDARAPIYYDRGNTAYYTRPSTSSLINTLYTAGTIQAGTSGVGNIYLGNNGGNGTGNHFRFHTNNSHTYFDGNCGDIHWRQGSSTRFIFYMTTANMTVNGTVTQNSDERIKENIITIDGALDKVNKLRGVYYNRTDINTSQKQIGLIAQEVETVIPEVVLTANDELKTKSISYAQINALLIEAIKEQKNIIDDLKSRVETLENQ